MTLPAPEQILGMTPIELADWLCQHGVEYFKTAREAGRLVLERLLGPGFTVAHDLARRRYVVATGGESMTVRESMVRPSLVNWHDPGYRAAYSLIMVRLAAAVKECLTTAPAEAGHEN